MQVDGFLCDAATVREKLLHVLGAGITRLWRDPYPAPMGADLALMLTLTQSEGRDQHRFRVVLMDADGKEIHKLEGHFGVQAGSSLIPGERLSVPIVLNMHGLAIPKEGPYSIDVLVDGTLQRSFPFVAAKPSDRPAPKQ